MKRLKWFLFSLSLLFVIGVLYVSFDTQGSKGSFFSGTVDEPEIAWSVETGETGSIVVGNIRVENHVVENSGAENLDAENFVAESESPDAGNVMLIRSHWEEYHVIADGKQIYDSSKTNSGAIRLIDIETASDIQIEFIGAGQSALRSLKQSQVYVGDRLGMYMILIRKNLYVAIFAIATLLMGIVAIAVGLYMRSAWTRDMCDALISLGLFILDAGVWIVTDSSLLLIFTQRSGLVELISFLAFYCLPVALLEFTRRMIPDQDRLFSVLQIVFMAMLILYALNNMLGFLPLTIVIVAEHMLMAFTIILVLRSCIRSLKKHVDRKLIRVLLGYIGFSVCSILALIFFYVGDTRSYSIAYMIGILGFVFFLAYAACIAVYEQIRENANLEIYSKMAFKDMMTELGNRAALLEEQKLLAGHNGSFAYIMIDANNLKRINDTLGHQKGDELLIEIARCIRAGVDGIGNCYRIGGDEFVVSLNDVTEEDTAKCADSIRNEVELADKQCDLDISAAIGYAWTCALGDDMDDLLKRADADMYENKMKMKQEKA